MHPDEGLERHSMETLPESKVGPLEEHLLICEVCEQRLEATDEFVATMRRTLIQRQPSKN